MVCGSPGLSGRRCLSIIRVAYTWNPTVSRGSTEEEVEELEDFEDVEVIKEVEEVESSPRYMHPSHGLKLPPPPTH